MVDLPLQENLQEKPRNLGASPVAEIDVLWITAGLGCDGDTIAMTAATQPSIEDIVLGAMPWIPKVNLHNPFLALANGDEFLRPFPSGRRRQARAVHSGGGRLDSGRNTIKRKDIGLRSAPIQTTGQPITTCEWIDRLAPKAWAVVAAGTCATYGGIHAMEGNPTGCMGLARLSGLGVEIEGGHSHRVRSGLPGAAGQFHGDAAVSALHGGRAARP